MIIDIATSHLVKCMLQWCQRVTSDGKTSQCLHCLYICVLIVWFPWALEWSETSGRFHGRFSLQEVHKVVEVHSAILPVHPETGGHYVTNTKLCIRIREIPANYHRFVYFVLYWFPPKMDKHLMNPGVSPLFSVAFRKSLRAMMIRFPSPDPSRPTRAIEQMKSQQVESEQDVKVI